jgi:nucleoside-diphosphate-sugar epimerase
VHIDDVVNAFLKAAVYIKNTTGNHYIISSGEGNTIKEAFQLITRKVSQILGIATNIKNVDAPNTLALIEHRNFIGDSNNFFKATGWRYSIKFNNGIENTINYFIGNRNG